MNKPKVLKHPQRGQTYSVAEIENHLTLRDLPCYQFWHGDRPATIQNSHLTKDEFLSVPGMADKRFVYQYETSEWVPVFTLAPGETMLDVVDIEQWVDSISGEKTQEVWVTPKGFPREQYVMQL